MKITRLAVLVLTVLAVSLAGCAVDRSELATPEAIRNLDENLVLEHCADVDPASGATEVASQSMEFSEAEVVIDEDGSDYVACIVTNKGIIEVTLFDDDAPVTVNNFAFLAEEGFYDGVLWHRVEPDFVIQGGDRNGAIAGRAGTGGPGYSWNDENSALALEHDAAGTLSMANAGPNTNGSQFFITHTPTPHLNGRHAVFGQISDPSALDLVLAIEEGDLIQTIQIVEIPTS